MEDIVNAVLLRLLPRQLIQLIVRYVARVIEMTDEGAYHFPADEPSALRALLHVYNLIPSSSNYSAHDALWFIQMYIEAYFKKNEAIALQKEKGYFPQQDFCDRSLSGDDDD